MEGIALVPPISHKLIGSGARRSERGPGTQIAPTTLSLLK